MHTEFGRGRRRSCRGTRPKFEDGVGDREGAEPLCINEGNEGNSEDHNGGHRERELSPVGFHHIHGGGGQWKIGRRCRTHRSHRSMISWKWASEGEETMKIRATTSCRELKKPVNQRTEWWTLVLFPQFQVLRRVWFAALKGGVLGLYGVLSRSKAKAKASHILLVTMWAISFPPHLVS